MSADSRSLVAGGGNVDRSDNDHHLAEAEGRHSITVIRSGCARYDDLMALLHDDNFAGHCRVDKKRDSVTRANSSPVTNIILPRNHAGDSPDIRAHSRKFNSQKYSISANISLETVNKRKIFFLGPSHLLQLENVDLSLCVELNNGVIVMSPFCNETDGTGGVVCSGTGFYLSNFPRFFCKIVLEWHDVSFNWRPHALCLDVLYTDTSRQVIETT